jgi:hypothetical protein
MNESPKSWVILLELSATPEECIEGISDDNKKCVMLIDMGI